MARVLYLKPKEGLPVALVQCDLLSGSLLLHHMAADIIADKTDVDSGGLMIAGTHTHSAPGNIYSSKFYNEMASNASGLDERYLKFCAGQIAEAVINAYNDKKPAKIATGTTEVRGVAKNRSFPAFLKNKTVESDECRKDEYSAVNPYLHMIRVDCRDSDGKYKPACAFTNFSIHPNTNPKLLGKLYNGDITGYTARFVEWEIKKRYKTKWSPVHAAVNYTHGDCNADYALDRIENFLDQRRLGNIISEKVMELFISLDDKLKSDAVIRFRAREVDLIEERSIDGINIAKKPAPGCASPGGALGLGKQTPFSYIPPFRPGTPRKIFTKGEQGHKRIVMGPLIHLYFKKENYPRKLLMQVIQIADTVLIPLPWEVTWELGRRIASGAETNAEKAGVDDIKRFVVTDTSNGYFGYVNTPEEYSIQYYEGSSNFYGPNTGPFIRAHASRLMTEMIESGSGSDLPDQWKFNLVARDFYPKDIVSSGTREMSRGPLYAEKDEGEESYWSFRWFDVPPAKIDFHKPLVKIQVMKDGKKWEKLNTGSVPVDDNGLDISTKFKNKIRKDNMALYEVRWHNPEKREGESYRFAILEREGQNVLYSPAFS